MFVCINISLLLIVCWTRLVVESPANKIQTISENKIHLAGSYDAYITRNHGPQAGNTLHQFPSDILQGNQSLQTHLRSHQPCLPRQPPLPIHSSPGSCRHKAGPCVEDMISSDLYITSLAFPGAVAWLSRIIVIVVCHLLLSLTAAATLSASSASRDCIKMNRQLPRLEGNRAS